MKKSRKILIIDDDPEMRKALQHILAILGHKSFCANNGKMALEILSHSEKPALIFCDIMMPTMNGLEFLSKLKKDSHHSLSSIPVVILSSEKNMSSEVALYGAGFLNKSFEVDELIRVIDLFC
ncbi:MAG: response regulator [Bacteriovorax sp.]|jgi:two-component system response regulator